MRKIRTVFGLILSFVLITVAVGMVSAQGDPLANSSFTPHEVPSAGGNTSLDLPFIIQSATIGEANVFCISHPNTVAPVWPASAVARQGDTYTHSTSGNSVCLGSEVEYLTPSAAAASSSPGKEEVSLGLTFAPLPAGDTYTFTIRQVECPGGAGCRSSNAPVDVDLFVAGPTAIQLDNFGAPDSTQTVLPVLLILMAIGSLGYIAGTIRQK